MQTKTRTALVALAIALPLSLSACGSDAPASSTPAAGGMSSSSMAPSPSMTSEMSTPTPSETMSSGGADAMSAVFGEGCALVPKDGKGSFNGMATDPVATAASNNPMLTTLTKAVSGELNKDVNLVDTLNGDEFTVFAPVDDAFKAIPQDDLDALAKDKDQLTSVLTYHVVPGQIAPADIDGTHKTVQGGEVTVKGSGDDIMVNDASVVCGGVKTKNATVYLIDKVLMPDDAGM